MVTPKSIAFWNYPPSYHEAEKIYNKLKSNEAFSVWWEAKDLLPGQRSSYGTFLNSAQTVILCFGNSSHEVQGDQRRYLNEIIEWYKEQGQLGITLIPVRLSEHCQITEVSLENLKILEYWENPAEAYNLLLQALMQTNPSRVAATNDIETELRYPNTLMVHSFCEWVQDVPPDVLSLAYDDLFCWLGDPLLTGVWNSTDPARAIADHLSRLPHRDLPDTRSQNSFRVSLLTLFALAVFARSRILLQKYANQINCWFDQYVIQTSPKKQQIALSTRLKDLSQEFTRLQKRLPSLERCLLVDINPDGVVPFYQLRASLVQANPYIKSAPAESKCLAVFEPNRSNGRSFAVEQLQQAFWDVYHQYCDYDAQQPVKTSSRNLYIVFFLPLELITQLDIHSWEHSLPSNYGGNCKIYSKHIVVVRSTERLRRIDDANWWERWISLQNDAPPAKISLPRAFICDNAQLYNRDAFEKNLNSLSVIGLGMAVPFRPYQPNQWHPLVSAYECGVALAAWGKQEAHTIKQELGTAMKDFFQTLHLPNLRDQHEDLNKRVSTEGLTLLVDNPNLLPPDRCVNNLRFQRPLAS